MTGTGIEWIFFFRNSMENMQRGDNNNDNKKINNKTIGNDEE